MRAEESAVATTTSRMWGAREVLPADDAYNVRVPTKAVITERSRDGVREEAWEGELQPLSTAERLRYLELKTNAWMNWGDLMSSAAAMHLTLLAAGNFYDLEGRVAHTACKKSTILAEFDPLCTDRKDDKGQKQTPDEACPGLFDHMICLDNFPPKDTPPHHAMRHTQTHPTHIRI
jgi:hypothetical protein